MRGFTDTDLRRYIEWQRRFPRPRVEEEAVVRLVEWLTSTPEGDEALRHINNTPRQRFLAFDSQEDEGREQ